MQGDMELELQREHLFFADVSALKKRRCSARRELAWG